MGWTQRVVGHDIDGIATWDAAVTASGPYAAGFAKDSGQHMFSGLVALQTTGPAAYVQGAYAACGVAADVPSFDCAFPAANTAGNCLVVDLFFLNSSYDMVTIADSLGNTYTPAVGQTVGGTFFSGDNAWVFVAPDCAGGANTVTVTSATGYVSDYIIAVHEYSGIAAASPVDAVSQAAVLAGDPLVQAVSVTTANENELLHLFSATHYWIADPAVFGPSPGGQGSGGGSGNAA